MNATLANHLSSELGRILPMWSEVDVEKAEDGDLILVARIPAKTDEGFELVPAFRLSMRDGSARVGIVGGRRRGDSAMAEVFKPKWAQMEAMKARLEKFWFDTHSVIFYAIEG